MMIRDIRLRWNSSQAMMARGLLLRDAVDDFAFNSKKYRHLLLSPEDWKSVESLNSILQVCSFVLFIAITD
ncbi:hypothetical protein PENSPDRAFT_595588 [Peniophora sp. CONT]|nr:hypothetical protein PENSPDRAFT_595588 [Peniophora sp. CONT]